MTICACVSQQAILFGRFVHKTSLTMSYNVIFEDNYSQQALVFLETVFLFSFQIIN